MDVVELLALPVIRAFEPELIVIASGLDTNGFHPLARMLANSGTFREMTRMVKDVVADICDDRAEGDAFGDLF